LVAVFVAIVIWALANRPSSAEVTPVAAIKINGIPQTYLMCDQMVSMKDTTIIEGRQRQDEAQACGANKNPECLPYYVQWRVLSELNGLLDDAIKENCSVS